MEKIGNRLVKADVALCGNISKEQNIRHHIQGYQRKRVQFFVKKVLNRLV